MIEITINGEKRSVPQGLNIAELVLELGLKDSILLAELNGEFILKDRFPEESVEQGDILELIRITGGG
jgi:thiamine biosynthesis protein ThiS